MLCIYNVTELPRSVPGWLLRQHGLAESVDALSGSRVQIGGDDSAWLPGYAAWWLVERIPGH